MKELEKNELKGVDGGFVIFSWTGWGDGIAGNASIDFLWWHIV